MIGVGRYTCYGVLAAGAARAPVQYGAQSLSKAADTISIQNAVSADAPSFAVGSTTPNTVAVSQLCSASGGAATTCATTNTPPTNTIYYVKVQVTGTFKPLITYVGLPSSIPVTGSAIMRVVSQQQFSRQRSPAPVRAAAF